MRSGKRSVVTETLPTYSTVDGELLVLDAEQYEQLVEDCRAIITERGLWARLEYLAAKWQIGERIATDPQYVKLVGGRGSESIISQLSQDMQWSSSEIYRCIQFYEQFSTLQISDGSPEALLEAFSDEGKAISWTRVKERYLPGGSEEKERPLHKKPVDREAIERLGHDRVGREWREEDQGELLALLGVESEATGAFSGK